MTSVEWAAWMQAVGSVVAILAAVAIAWWQHHEATSARERDGMARARSLALAILPSMAEYKKRVSLLANVDDRVSLSWIHVANAVEPGDTVQRNVFQLHELGAAAGAMQRLLRYSIECRETALSVSRTASLGADGQFENVQSSSGLAAVRTLDDKIDKAITALNALFDKQ